MQGRVVYSCDLHGTHIPWRSLKPVQWLEWLADQGIEPEDVSYTEAMQVVEYADGSLVMYCNRCELLPGSKPGDRSRVRVYPQEVKDGPITRTFISHHPVTSITKLLDDLDWSPEKQVVAMREFVEACA